MFVVINHGVLAGMLRVARGHSLRVTELVEVVGRRLGWDDARIGTLRLGALLHDVGKLTLPNSLLRKPGNACPAGAQAVRRILASREKVNAMRTGSPSWLR